MKLAAPLLILSLLGLGLQSCAARRTQRSPEPVRTSTTEDGKGYLAEGPTVHLQATENNRYATPLETLERQAELLDSARRTIASLEEKIEKIEKEKKHLGMKQTDLERSLMESDVKLLREKELQTELAEALARLRSRTLALETELFDVKRQILQPQGSDEEESEE